MSPRLVHAAAPPPALAAAAFACREGVPAHADPRIAQLHRYWDSRRRGGLLPGRADLEPLDIPRLLRCLFLVDVRQDEPRFVMRLMGTGVTAVLGEHTGRPLAAALGEEEAANALPEYERCAREGLPAWREGVPAVPRSRHAGFQRLLLPLAADGRRVDMLLGALVAFDWNGDPL